MRGAGINSIRSANAHGSRTIGYKSHYNSSVHVLSHDNGSYNNIRDTVALSPQIFIGFIQEQEPRRQQYHITCKKRIRDKMKYFLFILNLPAHSQNNPTKNHKRKIWFLIGLPWKKLFFFTVKNFPQIIQNTREIIENMSEIFQNISDIFFTTYTPADFQLLGDWPFLSAKSFGEAPTFYINQPCPCPEAFEREILPEP